MFVCVCVYVCLCVCVCVHKKHVGEQLEKVRKFLLLFHIFVSDYKVILWWSFLCHVIPEWVGTNCNLKYYTSVNCASYY